MKQHRFIGNFDLSENKINLSDRALIHQIKDVLRIGIGDKIVLADGNLNEALVEITNMVANRLSVEVISRNKNNNESLKDVSLYCSILKRENFELVVQKTTEVGIKKIIPIITERTVKLNFNQGRLEKIIKEASEQSGRGIIPTLTQPVKFEDSLKESEENKANILFHEEGDFFSQKNLDRFSKIGIWIGPEGGWTTKEIKKAQENKFLVFGLGKLTLRAETAAIVASYLVCKN
ncbi:16S rRNA (uracil(1498)-N(3))-methyltransferase [Candidatus Parcubacteria bacterium]|nr:MAG: 16S rRNA (uracil(1498)-N(3))-methyltransferase [Candidatus Parcubacteria bacterium]